MRIAVMGAGGVGGYFGGRLAQAEETVGFVARGRTWLATLPDEDGRPVTGGPVVLSFRISSPLDVVASPSS